MKSILKLVTVLYLEYNEEGVHLHEMQSKKTPSTPTN